MIPYLVTAIIFSLISFSVTFVINKQQRAKEEVLLVIHGGKSVDEAELRRVVSEKKLTVYWVGPEKGFRYVLNAAVTSSISLRYIPEGSSLGDNKVAYREIGTFVSANAFKVTQQAATLENGVGFVNVDGNAVYYDSRDAKNVYIGLKDADIQVEIFDPRPDQSLAEALMQGRVQKIK
ncbi:MAG: hypothetical protein NTX12_01705 [Actinobacteria bacterium]|nr:hypothetical protein [Actinomycetota bacterium]